MRAKKSFTISDDPYAIYAADIYVAASGNPDNKTTVVAIATKLQEFSAQKAGKEHAVAMAFKLKPRLESLLKASSFKEMSIFSKNPLSKNKLNERLFTNILEEAHRQLCQEEHARKVAYSSAKNAFQNKKLFDRLTPESKATHEAAIMCVLVDINNEKQNGANVQDIQLMPHLQFLQAIAKDKKSGAYFDREVNEVVNGHSINSYIDKFFSPDEKLILEANLQGLVHLDLEISLRRNSESLNISKLPVNEVIDLIQLADEKRKSDPNCNISLELKALERFRGSVNFQTPGNKNGNSIAEHLETLDAELSKQLAACLRKQSFTKDVVARRASLSRDSLC